MVIENITLDHKIIHCIVFILSVFVYEDSEVVVIDHIFSLQYSNQILEWFVL